MAISQIFNHVQLHVHWMHLLNTSICRYTCITHTIQILRYCDHDRCVNEVVKHRKWNLLCSVTCIFTHKTKNKIIQMIRTDESTEQRRTWSENFAVQFESHCTQSYWIILSWIWQNSSFFSVNHYVIKMPVLIAKQIFPVQLRHKNVRVRLFLCWHPVLQSIKILN